MHNAHSIHCYALDQTIAFHFTNLSITSDCIALTRGFSIEKLETLIASQKTISMPAFNYSFGRDVWFSLISLALKSDFHHINCLGFWPSIVWFPLFILKRGKNPLHGCKFETGQTQSLRLFNIFVFICSRVCMVHGAGVAMPQIQIEIKWKS